MKAFMGISLRKAGQQSAAGSSISLDYDDVMGLKEMIHFLNLRMRLYLTKPYYFPRGRRVCKRENT